MELEKFESYLTAEELKNYKQNLTDNNCPHPYKHFVKLSTKESVVRGAFTWIDTPEGHQYWLEINNRVNFDAPVTPSDEVEDASELLKGVDFMQYFTAEQWGELTSMGIEHLGMYHYQLWMDNHYTNIGSFIYNGIPTRKQSRFTQNIRMADSAAYRKSRGYVITPGEFMTKESATTDHDHVISVKRPDVVHTWSDEFMMEMTTKVYAQIQKLL